MPTIRNDVLKESAFETAADWSVSHGRRFRANIIIWGMRKHYSTLEVRTILADFFFFFYKVLCTSSTAGYTIAHKLIRVHPKQIQNHITEQKNNNNNNNKSLYYV